MIPICQKKENDCRALGKALLTRRVKPAIRFDCGTEDFVLPANRQLHAYFDKIGLKHTYKENPGGHDTDYWNEYIHDTLEFVTQHVTRS